MRGFLAGVFPLLVCFSLTAQEKDLIHLEAKDQHWVEELYWQGQGDVKITYRDMKVEAQYVELDWQNKIVTAEGDVVLTQKNSVFTAEHMVFNLDEKTGIFTHATGSFDGRYNFTGEKITKIDENNYQLEHGVFTSCDLESPPWSFTIRKARVEMGGYARMRGLAFKIRSLPLLYFPYLVWPAKPDRARGFLTPHLGHTFKRGSYLGLAYFIPMGESYDLTLMGDYYSKGYAGGGFQFRYHPLQNVKGQGAAYLIQDDQGEEWWKVKWEHAQDNLPWGFMLSANVELLSDIDFFREFERTFDRNTNRFVYSHVTFSKNWGNHSFLFKTDHKKTVFSSSSQEEITQSQLPEIEYRMRPWPILKTRVPLYFSLESRAHLFDVDKSETYRGTYGRFDLYPTLSSSISTIPWLSIRPSFGFRSTYYSKTLEGNQSLEGESFTRTYQLFKTGIVGPSFSKIFRSEKRAYKHLIEPRIEYQNLANLDDERQRDVPIYDEYDGVRGSNQVRYALVNRLFIKKGEEAAFEVASFELSQSYNFDDEQPLTSLTVEGETKRSQKSALNVALRYYPGSFLNIDTRATFHAITHRWDSFQLSGGFRAGSQYANLVYFKTNPQVESYTGQNQIRLYSGFKPFQAMDILAQVNYDIEEHYPPQQRYIVSYTGSCWALALEYRDYRLGESNDREYRITFDLKHVGSFLEITGGVDDLFGGAN